MTGKVTKFYGYLEKTKEKEKQKKKINRQTDTQAQIHTDRQPHTQTDKKETWRLSKDLKRKLRSIQRKWRTKNAGCNMAR